MISTRIVPDPRSHLLHSGTKTLESRCGSHYYVGCALAKGQLRVVTYLSPQSFDCEKDRIHSLKQ